jgi:hypothetical protein
VYKLIVTDRRKVELTLKSKGYEEAVKKVKAEKELTPYLYEDSTINQMWNDERPGFRFYNYTMKSFMREVVFHSAIASLYKFDPQSIPPVIDETGIDYKIDFEFIGDHSDIKEVERNLRKYGLDLIKGKARMKCVVVRDAL